MENDIERLREKGIAIVCAADQPAFNTKDLYFGVLVPLVAVDGQRFEDRDDQFPNRGRVWWMLRNGIVPDTVLPGTLWTVTLEKAYDYDPAISRKDLYQARFESVQPGAARFHQVLTLADEPDLDMLLADGIAVERPTHTNVVVRGPRSLLGPFKAAWDGERSRSLLRAINPGNPVVHRLPVDRLPEGALVEVSFTANHWTQLAPEQRISLALLHDEHVDALIEHGAKLDAIDDRQLANWGLKLANTPKATTQVIKQALEKVKLPAGSEVFEAQRALRFRRLLQDRVRVIDLGEELALAIAQTPAMEELVTRHVEAATAQRVEQEVQKRRTEVEEKIAQLDARRTKLAEELGRLETAYQARARELDEELQREHARRLESIDLRERAVREAEAQVAHREREIADRLQRLIEEYRDHADALTDRILTELPIIARIVNPTPVTAAQPSTLALPSFLGRTREPGGTITEPEFLDQFERVARQRGYAFERDDLANFHVSVKTGVWTVVAGPSGTGKSSLPRLYAEALGVDDELLWISVSPDWMDDRDVVGAYNALSGRFEPAPCGLVDRLIAAAEDQRAGRGGIYLVCLDEMNLARVEHYFARFLSVMEQPPDRRQLPLFAHTLASANDPYAPWRQLRVVDTVRFVGTVNVDETTHFFSPKVIDRAALMLLESPRLAHATGEVDHTKALGALTPVAWSRYREWIRAPVADGPTHELLLELDRTLSEHQSGIGYRTQRRVLSYLASADGLLTLDRAFDLAVSQLVIPRLRTSAPRFTALIDALVERMPGGRYPRAANLLGRLQEAGGELDFFQLL